MNIIVILVGAAAAGFIWFILALKRNVWKAHGMLDNPAQFSSEEIRRTSVALQGQLRTVPGKLSALLPLFRNAGATSDALSDQFLLQYENELRTDAIHAVFEDNSFGCSVRTWFVFLSNITLRSDSATTTIKSRRISAHKLLNALGTHMIERYGERLREIDTDIKFWEEIDDICSPTETSAMFLRILRSQNTAYICAIQHIVDMYAVIPQDDATKEQNLEEAISTVVQDSTNIAFINGIAAAATAT